MRSRSSKSSARRPTSPRRGRASPNAWSSRDITGRRWLRWRRSAAGSPQLAIAERLAGYAVVQSRAGFEEAKPHFERSLEAARAANAEYEVGLTLRAIAETSGVDDGQGTEILNRLGVVSTPSVPLP